MIKNLIFDLDGTLIDTSCGIINCMHYTFDQMSSERVNDEVIRDTIGPTLEEMLKILLNTSDKEKISHGVSLFRERYTEKGVFEYKVYPMAKETLECLVRRGIRLWIVTSKPYIFAENILKSEDLWELFVKVSGVHMDRESLSKTQRINQILEEFDLDRDETMMIGDRCEDINAANENKIKCIAVTYGFGKQKDLLEAGCYRICNKFEEIGDINNEENININSNI